MTVKTVGLLMIAGGLTSATLGFLLAVTRPRLINAAFAAMVLGVGILGAGGATTLQGMRNDAHTKAWAPVAATYDITSPRRSLPPTSPADAPVPVTGHVNGNPAACQAFHTGHTVKVTCNGTEADHR